MPSPAKKHKLKLLNSIAQEYQEAAVALSDMSEAVMSRNVLTDGRGCGVKCSGKTRCSLLHNVIMGVYLPLLHHLLLQPCAEVSATSTNSLPLKPGYWGLAPLRAGHAGSGVAAELSSQGHLDMRANRVTANAEYGASMAGGTCTFKANVIYANQKGGLCLRDTHEASLLANCIAGGVGEALRVEGAGKARILSDAAAHCSGNLLEGPGPQPDFRDVVMHSLEVLADWGRHRAGRLVIQTLGEISHVAVPARRRLKQPQLLRSLTEHTSAVAGKRRARDAKHAV